MTDARSKSCSQPLAVEIAKAAQMREMRKQWFKPSRTLPSQIWCAPVSFHELITYYICLVARTCFPNHTPTIYDRSLHKVALTNKKFLKLNIFLCMALSG